MSLMFHQAIQTIYLSPTNHKGARVKARCAKHSVTLNWEHGCNIEENHARAAMALVRKMEWLPGRGSYSSHWVGGGSPDGRGFVFVGAGDSVPVTYGENV